jgi:polar amino acid transport system substrate-binding protein
MMKKFMVSCIVVFCGVIAILGSANAGPNKTITLKGDVWPPYVMDPGEGKNGFMVDVAMAALSKYGFEVKFTNEPWTRTLDDLEKGRTDGVVGIYFSDAAGRKLVIPVEEIGISINKFYVKKDSSWKYSNIKSLEKIVLGVIDSYDYGEINPYIEAQKKLPSAAKKVGIMYGDKGLENNLKKLMIGRITATVEDHLVMNYTSSKMGLQDKIKEAGSVKPLNKVGIAFSPGNPMSKDYATALSSGIEKMRASGELKKILDKYGVKDWK